MQVFRLHESPAPRRDADVRAVMLGRTVVSCGMAEFPPNSRAHEGERHVHQHDEVFIVLSGEITVPVAGGESAVARAGDWVLVSAGEEHHLTNHTHLPCAAIYLVLAPPSA